MRTTRILLLATLAIVLLPTVAQASSRYCAVTGDYCTHVSDAPVTFELTSFAFSGKYTLTVKAPGGQLTTRTFTLKRKADVFKSTIRWAKHFPSHGKGTYAVTWKLPQPTPTTLARLRFTIG